MCGVKLILAVIIILLTLINKIDTRTVENGDNNSSGGSVGGFNRTGINATLALNNQQDEEDRKNCEKLSVLLLTEILGPAFNSRYMSIDTPIDIHLTEDADENKRTINRLINKNGKRTLGNKNNNLFLPFYVDDQYAQELSAQPAWELKRFNNYNVQRRKRSTSSSAKRNLSLQPTSSLYSEPSDEYMNQHKPISTSGRPWDCETIIKWIDLGVEYFPRYLRTVECTRHRCWYSYYTCQPRSFTIKILRRRPGKCVNVTNKYKTGVAGLPNDLRELWVWEERAVNFCCDCAIPGL